MDVILLTIQEISRAISSISDTVRVILELWRDHKQRADDEGEKE